MTGDNVLFNHTLAFSQVLLVVVDDEYFDLCITMHYKGTGREKNVITHMIFEKHSTSRRNIETISPWSYRMLTQNVVVL